MNTFSRRLLDAPAVAEKLGYSKTTFDHKRATLEAAGFPEPVLAADAFGTNRWDEAAIDAWLDLRMNPQLKAALMRPADADPHLANRLAKRAKDLQI